MAPLLVDFSVVFKRHILRGWLWIALITGVVHAQNELLPGMMFNARLGGIINSAYSNITAKKEYPDETSVIQRTPAGGVKKIRFGFELGADIYFLKSDKFRLV